MNSAAKKVVVEGMVRARGGREIWIKKGEFESIEAARAAWGHMLDSCYGSTFRIREI